jgi:ADP-ribose pyrophosphatase YjhB (NUDIX family)
MEINYCRRCGAHLKQLGHSEYICENNHMIFANSSPSTGLWIVNNKNEVLIAIRSREPGTGRYDSPGGFNLSDETNENSIIRELSEELGLKKEDYTQPQYLFSNVDSYSYGGETVNALCSMYWSRIIGNPTIMASDDVAEAKFIPINDIDPEMIYFEAPRIGFVMLKNILNTV